MKKCGESQTQDIPKAMWLVQNQEKHLILQIESSPFSMWIQTY